MLILLKKHISTNCVKCYIFCINLYIYIMFVLLSNIFILCQINIIIWVDYLGHRKCVKFNTNFLTVYKHHWFILISLKTFVMSFQWHCHHDNVYIYNQNSLIICKLRSKFMLEKNGSFILNISIKHLPVLDN